jgi:hypothetical protein
LQIIALLQIEPEVGTVSARHAVEAGTTTTLDALTFERACHCVRLTNYANSGITRS